MSGGGCIFLSFMVSNFYGDLGYFYAVNSKYYTFHIGNANHHIFYMGSTT